jgi:hypothetical protein
MPSGLNLQGGRPRPKQKKARLGNENKGDINPLTSLGSLTMIKSEWLIRKIANVNGKIHDPASSKRYSPDRFGVPVCAYRKLYRASRHGFAAELGGKSKACRRHRARRGERTEIHQGRKRESLCSYNREG